MPTHSGLAFLAGSVAGGLGQLVGFPLDAIKVKRQLGIKRNIPYFRVAAGPVLTAGVTNCICLGTYDNTRRYLGGPGESPIWAVAAGGTASGVAISPITCAVARVKVLQQTGCDSILETVRRAAAARGIGTFFVGFGLNCAMECFRCVYMASYVSLKRFLSPGADPPLWVSAVSAAVAGCAGWVVIYPLDVVRANMQAVKPWREGERETAGAILKRLLREGGVMRLYQGLGWTLLRGGPVSAVLLPTFDLVLGFLEGIVG